MHLASKGLAQHGPHDGPDIPEPIGWIENQKQFDLCRGLFALEGCHQGMPIRNGKIGHGPITHVGHEDNSIAARKLILQHALHDIDKIVNDVLRRCLSGNIPVGLEVKDVLSSFGLQLAQWEHHFGAELPFHAIHAQLIISVGELFQDLGGLVGIEFTAPGKAQVPFHGKWMALALSRRFPSFLNLQDNPEFFFRNVRELFIHRSARWDDQFVAGRGCHGMTGMPAASRRHGESGCRDIVGGGAVVTVIHNVATAVAIAGGRSCLTGILEDASLLVTRRVREEWLLLLLLLLLLLSLTGSRRRSGGSAPTSPVQPDRIEYRVLLLLLLWQSLRMVMLQLR